MQLPSNLTIPEFDQKFRLQPELWQAAIIECCDLHELPSENLKPYKDGTNLVARVNDQHIVKIFPPFLKHQWDSEHLVLKHLHGKLKTNIPKLTASGRRTDNWHYVIVSKLDGITFESNWNQFSDVEKSQVLKQVGQIMKSVHKVEVGALKTLKPEWSAFYNIQIEKARVRHQRLNMPTWFLNELPEYLEMTKEMIPEKFDAVILTGEYTPFNLMTASKKTPHVTGMIDFGDAMIGYNEYDFLGPSLFMAEGKPELVSALFEGYGLSKNEINEDLRNRLMRLQILHRYSHFQVQIRIPDWEKQVKSIKDLAHLIWPI